MQCAQCNILLSEKAGRCHNCGLRVGQKPRPHRELSKFENAGETIKYVCAVFILEIAIKSLDVFLIFIAPTAVTFDFFIGSVMGVAIRIICVWYFYKKKSRIAAILFFLFFLYSAIQSRHILSAFFIVTAGIGVISTFLYHLRSTKNNIDAI